MNKSFKGILFAFATMLTVFFSVCVLSSFTGKFHKHVFVNLCSELSGTTERFEIDLSVESYSSPLTLETDPCGSAVNLPNNTFDSGTNVGSTAEVGEPLSPGLVDASTASTVWYTFTVPEGQSTINITFQAGTIQNPVVSFYTGGCLGTLTLVDESDFNGVASYPSTSSDVCLAAGTYKVRVATDSGVGDNGTYTIKINAVSTPTTNEDCTSPMLPVVVAGVNNVENICSNDGKVWYQYTFTGGVSADHINVSTPTPGFGIGSMFLNDCVTPVTAATCLKAGDIVHIEAGDLTIPVMFGNFVLSISEFDSPVSIDDCIDVVSNPQLTCSNSISGAGNAASCPDAEATCASNIGDPGVWYKFSVSNQVTEFNITGTDFEVYEGTTCGGLTSYACAGSALLNGIDPDAVSYNYYVLVYNSGSFTAIADPQTPANDLCSNAGSFGLTSGVPVNGSNACATPSSSSFCGLSTVSDHVVYYSYTTANTLTSTNLTFNYAGSGVDGATDLNIGVYSACNGTLLFSSCDNSPEEYECVRPNTPLIIAVGSPDGSEGDFTLTVTASTAGIPLNDLCTNATSIPFSAPADNCTWQTVNGDNTDACPETFAGSCNFNSTPTVWYSITIPGNAVGLDFMNLTGGISIGVFNNNCSAPGYSPTQTGACLSGDGLISVGGGTYLIAVTSNGSPFSFDIRVKVPPTNDLCANKISLTLNNQIVGSTECATSTGDFVAGCAAANQNAVWYSYNVVTDTKTLTLTVDNFSSGGTLSVVALAGCGSGAYYNSDNNNEECGNTVTLDIDCPVGGTTIYFAVSSTAAEEGTFDIEITQSQAITVTNDDCVNAIAWTPLPVCVVEQFGPYSNVTACPETFDVGSCDFDNEETVWFSVTVPADAKTMDIGLNGYSGTGNGVFGIFSNCGGTSIDNVCHTAVSGGDPVANGDNVDVTSYQGTTLYIAFASQGDDGGNVTFDIKMNNPPDNDDACTPEVVSAGVTMGTTFCADQEFTDPNCGSQDDNQVWFEYTLGGGETGLEVTLTNTGSGGPFAVTLAEFTGGCTNAPTILSTTSFSCDAETGVVKATCLDAGTVIAILVSSSTADQGTFSIDVQPVVPDPNCVDNDACADAEDLGELTTDADCTLKLDCNENACAETFGGCNGNVPVNNVVWYQVQNDGLGEFIKADVTNAAFDEPVILIFKGPNCNSLTLLDPCTTGTGGAAGTGPIDIDPSGNPPVAGENYYIAIGSTDVDGGDFELCIEILSGCVNDDACDAVELTPDAAPISNPASTINCTPDYDNTNCPGSVINTVWYKFTMPAGTVGAQVRLYNVMIVGDVSIQVGEYSQADCSNLTAPVASDCLSGTSIQFDIPCLQENQEYYVQIGSAGAMDAGSFEIQIRTFLPVVPNDLCSMAEVVDITAADYCEYIEITGTTLDACTEAFGGNSCPYNTESTVWYLVNIPNDPQITLANFEVVGNTLTNPSFSVWQNDCANPVQAAPGTFCVSTGANNTAVVEDVAITPGSSYLIPVTSSSGDHGTFTLRIKVIAPPANDDCDNAVSISAGGSETGTTDCATHQNGLEFSGCTANLDEADVWYTIPIDPSLKGIKVTVSGWTGGGNYGVEAYTSVSGCVLTTMQNMEDCSAADPKEFNIATGCMDPSITAIYVKVGSDSDDTQVGDFTIQVDPLIPSCTYADICDEAPPAGPLITDPNFAMIFPRCQTGCLDLACPDTPPGVDCGFSVSPTVWFHFTVDDIAAQLFTSVETGGTWDPVWSVYQGTSCADMTQIAGGPANSPACSNGDNTPTLHQTAVDGTITDYWVAVTADPNGPPIDDPTFEICAYTTINAIVCLGDITDNCNPDPSLILEVLDRSNGGSLDGPFCPGEEVTVRIKFFYDASETGADWLIGVIPSFGPGWDIENFDAAGNAPAGSEWYDEQGSCPPFIDEPVPHLCVYTGADGLLHLCNSLCENCNTLCDHPGMAKGDLLPSGWFWVSTGGNAGCLNDCRPGEGWGIGSSTSNIDFNITLKVKEFATEEECLQNKNLQISFQTFSDGVAGCWEDPVGECLIDRKQFGPIWQVECQVPPGVIATPNPFEICKMGITDITVSTDDGSAAATIIVTYDDNPDVTGEMDHTFTGGYGVINDNLTNTSNQIQTVTYHAYSEVAGLICKGPVSDFEVILYPELLIEFPEFYVCPDYCTTVEPSSITGGTGIYVTYQWSTGATTPSITVCPPASTTYILTVTDTKGCTGTKSVEVEVKPRVITEINPDQVFICQNSVEGDSDPIVIDFISGSSPYSIDWIAPFGLIGHVVTTNEDNDTYVVEEELSFFTFPNAPYVLCANISDQFGCLDTVCVEVNISGRPEAILTTASPVLCGQTTTMLHADFGFGGGLSNWQDHQVFDCNGEFVAGGGAASSNFGPVDLTECNEFYLYTTNQDGCVDIDTLIVPLTTGVPAIVDGDEICDAGTNGVVSVTNAASYASFLWDTGQTTPSIIVNPSQTTTYIVTCTEPNGCISIKSAQVIVHPTPPLSLSGSTTFCTGSSTVLQINSDPGNTFSWSNAGGVISNADTVLITTAGAYTAKVTSVFGCTKDSTINVTVGSSLTISLNSIVLCDNAEDTLSAGSGFAGYNWSFTPGGGSTTALPFTTSEIPVTLPGSYCVTVSDNGSCTGNTCEVVVNNSTPIVNVTDTVTVCRTSGGSGTTIINFNAQATGATGTWENTDLIPGLDLSNYSSVDFAGVLRDTYTFTFMTNNAINPCNDISKPMEVIVVNCPCPTINPIAAVCNSSSTLVNLNNYIANNPNGINGTWEWSAGPQNIAANNGNVSVNNVAAGTYQFSWSPIASICAPITASLPVIAPPIADVTPGPHYLCNLPGGQYSTQVNLNSFLTPTTSLGGTWVQTSGNPVNGTIPNIDVNGLAVGNVVFTYTTNTAVSPCQDVSATVTITVRDCSCPFADIKPTIVCNDSAPFNLNDSLTIDPPGTLGTWSSPTAGVITGSNFNPQGLFSGQYNVTFTLNTDPGPNCTKAFSGIVLVRNKPIAEKLADGEACSKDTGNGSTKLNLFSLLKSNYSPGGIWTQVSGTPSISILPNGDVDFDGQTIGANYSFRYTTTNAVAPCTNASAVVNVKIKDCLCPNTTIAIPDPICNSADTYNLKDLEDPLLAPGTWSVKKGNTNVPVIGDSIFNVKDVLPGDYTLTYTLVPPPIQASCPKTVVRTLRIEAQKFAEVKPTVNICNDGSILNFNDQVLNGEKFGIWENTQNAAVNFTNPGLVPFTNTVNEGDMFIFTYKVDSEPPCEDRTYTILVNVSCVPCLDNLPKTPTPHCTTEGIVDLSQYNDPNRPGAWSSTLLTINNNKVDLTNVQSGNYTITYTPTDLEPTCPTVNKTLTVIKPGNPGIAADTLSICDKLSQLVDLASLISGEDNNGKWREVSSVLSTGGAFNAVNGTFNTNGVPVNTYEFEYYFTNQAPCPDTKTRVFVRIDDVPTASAGLEQELTCTNAQAELGTSSSSVGPNISYQWTHDGGLPIPNDDKALTSVDFPGVFTILVTNTSTGCTATDAVTISEDPNRPSSLFDIGNISCFGAKDGYIKFTNVKGTNTPFQYSIDGGATFVSTPDFNNLSPGTYKTILKDANGCIFSDEFDLIQPANLGVSLGRDTTVLKGSSVLLNITNQIDLDRITKIVWVQTDDKGKDSIVCSSSPTNPCLTYNPVLTKSVKICVTISDDNGCEISDCVDIRVKKVRNITFPNVFSPNDEGENETFYVDNDDVGLVTQMRIYDRWGNLVFVAKDILPNKPELGWNGTLNGKNVAQGVYTWLIDVIYADDGTTDSFAGDVTVVR